MGRDGVALGSPNVPLDLYGVAMGWPGVPKCPQGSLWVFMGTIWGSLVVPWGLSGDIMGSLWGLLTGPPPPPPHSTGCL